MKYNTINQRTWHAHKDPAIDAVENLRVDNTKGVFLPQIDNTLSLPLSLSIIYE